MSMESALKNKDEIKQLREAFQQARKEFIRTMTKDSFNLEEAKAAMQKSLQAQNLLESKLGESLIEVRTRMTAEQAKRFFEHRLNRRHRSDQPPENEPKPEQPEDQPQQGDTQ